MNAVAAVEAVASTSSAQDCAQNDGGTSMRVLSADALVSQLQAQLSVSASRPSDAEHAQAQQQQQHQQQQQQPPQQQRGEHEHAVLSPAVQSQQHGGPQGSSLSRTSAEAEWPDAPLAQLLQPVQSEASMQVPAGATPPRGGVDGAAAATPLESSSDRLTLRSRTMTTDMLVQSWVARMRRIFAAFADEGDDGALYMTKRRFVQMIRNVGIEQRDPRLARVFEQLEEVTDTEPLPLDDFARIVQSGQELLEKMVQGRLTIPDFRAFADEVRRMFDEQRTNTEGHVATYIPQLGRVPPSKWGVSVCTVDGQRCNFGDCDDDFCVQSTCKPINYCIALEERGEDLVHAHIGREPSGHGFNNLALDRNHKPHNPMINSGAIMCCALIQPSMQPADRFDHVMGVWGRLAASKVKFNNSVYLSERQTADRNFALAYFMREHHAFPEGVDLQGVLEFYFQCCSIEMTARQMATVAATLASGGICPMTGERVFSQATVKHCLSLMHSCGMYDYSGEFAYVVGLPAKSGVSGALMVVVPNVMGFCTWSPPLGEQGNSVRGVAFCKRLVEVFNFHSYDLMEGCSKRDPRKSYLSTHVENVSALLWAVHQSDAQEVSRLLASGADINCCDFDGRTALHVAASEGLLPLVKFLVHARASVNVADRWGNTPLADAVRAGNDDVAAYLRKHGGTSDGTSWRAAIETHQRVSSSASMPGASPLPPVRRTAFASTASSSLS